MMILQDILNTMDGISTMLSIGLTASNETSVVVTSDSLSVGAVQLNPLGDVTPESGLLAAGNLTVDLAGVLGLTGLDSEDVSPTNILNVSYNQHQGPLLLRWINFNLSSDE